jgi:hypothetical protein
VEGKVRWKGLLLILFCLYLLSYHACLRLQEVEQRCVRAFLKINFMANVCSDMFRSSTKIIYDPDTTNDA